MTKPSTGLCTLERSTAFLLAAAQSAGCVRLMGWAMGESLETGLPMDALQMALRQRQPGAGLLHHSDRGCPYASEAYREHLAAWQVTPSMSRRGNCYDNAAMESFWSTLKAELVHRAHFESRAQAASAIFEYIETFYNRERLHSALGFISLVEFEKPSNLNYSTNSQAPPCPLNRGNLSFGRAAGRDGISKKWGKR